METTTQSTTPWYVSTLDCRQRWQQQQQWNKDATQGDGGAAVVPVDRDSSNAGNVLVTTYSLRASHFWAECAALSSHRVDVYGPESYTASSYAHGREMSCDLVEYVDEDFMEALEDMQGALGARSRAAGAACASHNVKGKTHWKDILAARSCSAVYAVGEPLHDQSVGCTTADYLPAGGAWWTIVAFLCRMRRQLASSPGHGTECAVELPLYFFVESRNVWLNATMMPTSGKVIWCTMRGLPPKPAGCYAGVGSQFSGKISRQAVWELYFRDSISPSSSSSSPPPAFGLGLTGAERLPEMALLY